VSATRKLILVGLPRRSSHLSHILFLTNLQTQQFAMKTFTLVPLVVPATAFVSPGIQIRWRDASIANPSWQHSHYASSPNPSEYDSSFEDLRREFTSSSEPSAGRVKEVVGRTFRFFQDLNREGSSSSTERLRTEELLGKLEKWIDRTIEFSDSLSKDFSEPNSRVASSPGSDDTTTVPIGGNELDIALESRTTENAFEVQLDVPGVELADLDIRLDETLKIVTVLGQRGGRSFSRGVALDSEADIQQLSATLKNGVLTLRAPKVKPPASNLKRIPVVVADA
jgi:HSP20 family molecular chaperone IbpA